MEKSITVGALIDELKKLKRDDPLRVFVVNTYEDIQRKISKHCDATDLEVHVSEDISWRDGVKGRGTILVFRDIAP